MSVPRFARLLVVGLVSMLALVPSAITFAAAPTRELIVNTPFTVQGFCSFDVQVDPLVSNEYITTFTDTSGNITKQIVTGAFKARLTNVMTGQSLVVNASGPARILPQPNGTTVIYEGQTLYMGSAAGLPLGLYLISGKVTATPTTATVEGHATDLCAALAG